MTWKYHGKQLDPSAGRSVYGERSIGRELSHEQQLIIDQAWAGRLNRLEERHRSSR